jgi:hypothetical protein
MVMLSLKYFYVNYKKINNSLLVPVRAAAEGLRADIDDKPLKINHNSDDNNRKE